MELLTGNKVLTKRQCDVLRGIAIMGIFLHNFCHWLHGGHHENEYLFFKEHSMRMWDYWNNVFSGNFDGFEFIQFFSFFGHYGVPLFLFLSGFGLVMKYERAGEPRVKALPFIGYQWLKLFRLMILGYVLSVLVYDVWCGCSFHLWNEVVSQLTLIVNLIFESPGRALMPGPYWFFGLMFEVYIMYALCIYSTRDKKLWRWLMPVALIVVAWLPMALSEVHTMHLEYMRYNVVVAILPFMLGVIVARYGMPKLPKWALVAVAIISMPMLAVFNLDFQSWLWAPVLVIAGSVAFVKLFDSYSATATGVVMRPLAWMGVMSSCIFVVHSLPRMPIFKFVLWLQPNLMYSDYAWLAVYIALTLLLAWLYKQYLKFVPSVQLRNGTTITFGK
ncbi:MAG: acyltransferase [Muribaculaceae bacterium]|nr:acyltransferase [Muribaculaceae bacterium]